ncbi:MAG: cell filamentation protein Fic, partial [Deltaproteobacteria bacterium]
MTNYNQKSHIFQGFLPLEEGASLAGYAALIVGYGLRIPMPDYLCAIGIKHKKYGEGRWRIFTPRHRPHDTLYGHLTFALKYEGINLAVVKALFDTVEPKAVEDIIRFEPTGAYSRRLWFLWEWL